MLPRTETCPECGKPNTVDLADEAEAISCRYCLTVFGYDAEQLLTTYPGYLLGVILDELALTVVGKKPKGV